MADCYAMEAELRKRMLAGNQFIAGLVEQFGNDRVWDGSLAVLKMPASWITTNAEAIRLHDHLAATKEK